MLLESNTESMQSLIDLAFDAVKENCEKGYYVMAHHDYICNPIEMIEEIKVVEVSKKQVMDYFEKDNNTQDAHASDDDEFLAMVNDCSQTLQNVETEPRVAEEAKDGFKFGFDDAMF